ncbi:MAG: metallophosphoesterase, partial [Bacteroidales bacterium]|nr:metallophosphoesterase [Bacteroidales bacterium]
MLYYLFFIALFFSSTICRCGEIIYPWRSTTAIVQSGHAFEVWFNADAGQKVYSAKLRGPYNIVDATINSISEQEWIYDQWSGNTCNRKFTVSVPADAPADRYDLVLYTSTGEEISLKSVKVIREYKSSYYIFHISDGHRWEKYPSRDSMVSLREQSAVIEMANIIDPEIIFETGDNMWGNQQSMDQRKSRAATYFSGGKLDTEVVKGLNDAYAAVFICPGNHDSFRNNYSLEPDIAGVAKDWNELYGLQSHCFEYGSARFIGINNSWCPTTGGGEPGYIPNYKWQIDEAIDWINSVGPGNFRVSYQHVPQESLPPIYYRFKEAGVPLDMMIAGHIHRSSTNPYSIDGKSIIYCVEILGTAVKKSPFNLYKVDATAGTYTPIPDQYAASQGLVAEMDYSTIKLRLSYSKPNDGSNTDNVGTIVNDFTYAITSARIRFVVPKGNSYLVTGGTIEQEFDGTDYHIVDVSY